VHVSREVKPEWRSLMRVLSSTYCRSYVTIVRSARPAAKCAQPAGRIDFEEHSMGPTTFVQEDHGGPPARTGPWLSSALHPSRRSFTGPEG